jgi:DNA polymerase-1
MKAMLNLYRNKRLNELGWRQVLQVHDELILEGPKETVKEAYDIIVKEMSQPLSKPLLVDLVVDAKIGKSWWEAK